MVEDEELVELFNSEQMEVIYRNVNKLIISLSKELKINDVGSIVGIWNCINLAMMRIHKEHPDVELQRLMNILTLSHSKILDRK